MRLATRTDRSRGDEIFVAALRRVRRDFLDMPGLQLTPAQAARSWTFDLELCQAVFDALLATHFLTRTTRATFARRP
jgi:hypothetical protein